MIVLDKYVERRLRAQRTARGIDQHDEVWEGVYVMSPIADIVHQTIVSKLTFAFEHAIGQKGLGKVYPGINVSDRIERWTKNYRTPDVVVILNGSPAENHDKFWTGPIDFVVEVVSPRDRSKRKLPFYSKIGVRELLLIERKPWRLSLYGHNGAKLEIAAICEPDDGRRVESGVLPFSFQLVTSSERPEIELQHNADGRSWRA
jgi:Uma2 family endonuclease